MTKRARKTSNSKVSSRASEVLKDSASKSLAGSVLSQTSKSRTASFSTKSIAERILTRHDKAFSELSKK